LANDKEIRGASGMPSVRDGLRGINQVGEFPTTGLRKSRHLIRGIIRILRGIIGINRYKGDAFCLELGGEASEHITNVNDIWAMVACENDNQRLSMRAIFTRPDLSTCIGQSEARSRGAQGKSLS
jgi:hypothetical protein